MAAPQRDPFLYRRTPLPPVRPTAPRVLSHDCWRTDRAHRYPRAQHYVVKYSGLARACILLRYRNRTLGTAVVASAFTSRQILAAPRSTGVKVKSRPKARVHAYAHRGLARILYKADALLAFENGADFRAEE